MHYRKHVLAVVAAALVLSLGATTVSAKIETKVLQSITLEDTPKDITLSKDGSTAYILVKNAVLVFSVREKKVTDRIALDGSFSQIALSADDEKLFLTGNKKNLTILEVSRVYDIPIGTSPVLGDADAPVTVTAFLDIQCPYCAKIYPTLEKLLKKHPKDVKLVVKHFPLRMHRFAQTASQGALAAARQDKYAEILPVLFKNFRKLKDETLKKHAKEVGLDMQQFEKDLKDPKLKKQVQDDMRLGRSVKVRGVPAVFINGRNVKTRSLSALSNMIKKELKK